ncbi:hypothetical protein MiSe_70920 [Microseira wollei NIES-4236]|uniref:HTH cro/C1-type domain-containing protein n=2 Tax=Microseira wollei TaxID=467598 RepID=A0AAV3XP85_9CYAN|nr:hypothetical protein MiSe_70920 [Microseira wollei NIES-4236]
MAEVEIQPWLFEVEPLEGKSLSHFLARFRRPNHLTPSSLGQWAGVGAVVARWERFDLNPPPSQKDLAALAKVVGVSAERLAQMLPPKGVGLTLSGLKPLSFCGQGRLRFLPKSDPRCGGIKLSGAVTSLAGLQNGT